MHEQLLSVGAGERILVGVETGADGAVAVMDGTGEKGPAGEVAQSQATGCR